MTGSIFKNNLLVLIGGVVALSPSVALAVLVFSAPFWSPTAADWDGAVVVGFIALAGTLSGAATIYSIRHGERWAWAGLILGFILLATTLFTPAAIGVAHWYMLVGAFYVGLAAVCLLNKHNPWGTR